jgi:hypothetical protein
MSLSNLTGKGKRNKKQIRSLTCPGEGITLHCNKSDRSGGMANKDAKNTVSTNVTKPARKDGYTWHSLYVNFEL